MEITEVRVSPSKGGKVRAFASIVIDDCFIVNDLRVMEGREGQLFVTMPARRSRGGQLRDIAHPLNSEMRRVIEEQVLGEYQRSLEHLALPDREDESRDGGPRSPLTRLASKLFSEEFWVNDDKGSDRSDDS